MPTWTAPRLPPPDNTNAVVIADSRPLASREGGGEARKGQRREEQPEIAERDVVVVADQQEVDD
jgi:hypothetical protein